MNRLLLTLLLLALAGCQSAATLLREGADFLPPPGTRLILQQALVIPAGYASTYLQYGQALRYAGINTYHPHCRFEVREVGEVPQTVAADEFRVTRASHEYRSTVRAGERIRLAAASARVTMGGQDGGGPSPVAHVTLLKLKSVRQPNVLSLACGHWTYTPNDRFLNQSEIRQALGNLVRLELPSPSGRSNP